MFNNFEDVAKQFIEKNDVKMVIRLIGADINNNWGDGVLRMKYRFTIETKRGSYSGCFWGGKYDPKNIIPVSSYDIFSCITKYNPGTFNEFCLEFGYDNNSIKATRIYQDVWKEWEGISKIFSRSQIEELREIQ